MLQTNKGYLVSGPLCLKMFTVTGILTKVSATVSKLIHQSLNLIYLFLLANLLSVKIKMYCESSYELKITLKLLLKTRLNVSMGLCTVFD